MSSLSNKATIIAVDMDGTLSEGTCWTPKDCLNATPNIEMIKYVNKLSVTKHVVIYTARRDNLIPTTLQWLRKHEVDFNAISNTKMAADAYIDDKAINVNDSKLLNELIKTGNYYD